MHQAPAAAPFPDSYRIRPDFLAGHYPSLREGEVSALLAEGVTLFLDLTEPGELEPYAPCLPPAAHHCRLPIPDFQVPSPGLMDSILNRLDAALAEGGKVYLHCRGGMGRTGTVVGCFLVRHGMAGDQALARIRELRTDYGCDPHSPETEAQRAMVRGWPGGA